MPHPMFTPLALGQHPVDLMCEYLLAGAPERMAGLVDPDRITHEYLSGHHDGRSAHEGAEMFEVVRTRRVRGRTHGVSFAFYFTDGVRTTTAVKPFGAPVDLAAFLRRFRAGYAPTAFDVYTSGDSCRRFPDWDWGAVRFADGREILFEVSAPTRAAISHVAGDRDLPGPGSAGGAVHPDRWLDLDDAVRAGTTLLRPYLSRLDSPPPLRANVPGRTRRRRR